MSETVMLALILAVPPTITAVAAAIAAIRAGRKVEQVHVSLNSRLDALLKTTAALSRIEGRDQERADVAARRDDAASAR